jgi:hypothetical protein
MLGVIAGRGGDPTSGGYTKPEWMFKQPASAKTSDLLVVGPNEDEVAVSSEPVLTSFVASANRSIIVSFVRGSPEDAGSSCLGLTKKMDGENAASRLCDDSEYVLCTIVSGCSSA